MVCDMKRNPLLNVVSENLQVARMVARENFVLQTKYFIHCQFYKPLFRLMDSESIKLMNRKDNK